MSHVHGHVYVQVCPWTHARTHTHVQAHAQEYAHAKRYAHTHTHTHTHKRECSLFHWKRTPAASLLPACCAAPLPGHPLPTGHAVMCRSSLRRRLACAQAVATTGQPPPFPASGQLMAVSSAGALRKLLPPLPPFILFPMPPPTPYPLSLSKALPPHQPPPVPLLRAQVYPAE